MITNPLDFAAALIAYCGATRASVTSWGRTPAHNKAVGGVPTSYHTAWLGADVIYDLALPAADRSSIARHLGLEVIHESDHDHIEPIG